MKLYGYNSLAMPITKRQPLSLLYDHKCQDLITIAEIKNYTLATLDNIRPTMLLVLLHVLHDNSRWVFILKG